MDTACHLFVLCLVTVILACAASESYPPRSVERDDLSEVAALHAEFISTKSFRTVSVSTYPLSEPCRVYCKFQIFSFNNGTKTELRQSVSIGKGVTVPLLGLEQGERYQVACRCSDPRGSCFSDPGSLDFSTEEDDFEAGKVGYDLASRVHVGSFHLRTHIFENITETSTESNEIEAPLEEQPVKDPGQIWEKLSRKAPILIGIALAEVIGMMTLNKVFA